MKKLHLTAIILLLCMASIIAGCAPNIDPTEDVTTKPTVLDHFTDPTTAPTNTTTPVTNPTNPTGNNAGFPDVGPSGTVQHGFGGELLVNDQGRYNVYTGGEMQIDYHISATGSLAEYEIGILLILDGHPQPYKTATDGTYKYMHVFSAEDGQTKFDIEEEFIFIPVTGQNGDTLELTAFQVINPSYYPREQFAGNMQTFGSVTSGTQLVYESTPPAMEQVSIPERVVSYSVENIDLTSDDVKNWSADDLERNVSFVIGSQNQIDMEAICNISAGDPLNISAEIFGATAVDWSLIFYVDHMPVSVLEENSIAFKTISGKKTVVEVTLDMYDFNGEGTIFAVLCAKNRRLPEVLEGTNCSTEITSTYYLTDVSSWLALREKYNGN